ncbi:MAG: hypothetical protein ACK566_04275, partial [Bacteroidota bacterium]
TAPASPTPPPVVPPPLFGNGARKDALNKIRQNLSSSAPATEPQPVVQVMETEDPVPYTVRPVLTAEKVRQLIEEYIAQLDQSGSRVLLVIYKDAKIDLVDADRIEMRIGSSHEAELIEEDRNNLMPYLRKQLKIPTLEMQLKIDAAAVVQKAFTAEDRFKAMTEKNPLLTDFRNKLHLEIE